MVIFSKTESDRRLFSCLYNLRDKIAGWRCNDCFAYGAAQFNADIQQRKKELNDIRKLVLAQKESGVIVLPAYCEPIIVPNDIEICIGDLTGEFVEGEKS